MPPSLRPGDMIGPYRVLSELGQGGFGAVYRCEQTSPVRREVAVKVLKLGMDTREVIARFAIERQALAKMDHSCVARVLDAGATEAGRPYFVMELVHGEGIAAYCERRRLSIDERLSLFREVCDAVQHAHHKGIIHRDLKPSNVLITEVEGRPLPKIIDFGVAKALDPTAEDMAEARSSATQMGQLIGTPEYMSPEQATMSSLDLDTRTDIYSLGVILYQLLCGELPTDARSLRAASALEVQRLLREQNPLKPSAKFLQHSEPDQQRIAAARRTQPDALFRKLRGDLDWVTMKAAHKDRTQRYSSAAELASDIRRHLSNLPVLASPPSFRYRFSKFARRNRGLVGAVATAVLLLSGAGVAITIQAVRIAVERDRAVASEKLAAAQSAEAQAARQKAELETAKSRQQTAFLREMFAGVDPAVARGTEYSVRELLDQAAQKLDGPYDAEPELLADLRMTVGTSYLALGRYEQALTQLERAVEERRKALGPDHLDTLDSENELARVYERLGRAGDALPLFEHVLEQRQARLGDTADATLSTKNNLAVIYRAMARPADAERLHREVLGVRQARLGSDDISTLNSMFNLAQVLEDQGKTPESEELFRTTYERRLATLGPDHPHTMLSAHTYAMVLRDRGKAGEAEPMMRTALAERERVLGADHPETLDSRRGLAMILRDLRKFDEAQTLARATLDAQSRLSGGRGADWLKARALVGVLALDQGRLQEAESIFRDVADEYAMVAGPKASPTLSALNNLATALEKLGRLEEAAEIQRRVYDARISTYGRLHQSTIIAAANLANGLIKAGSPEAAVELARDNSTASASVVGESHYLTGVVRGVLGEALLASGDIAAARTELTGAYQVVASASGPTDRATQRIARLLSTLEARDGKSEAAALWKTRAGPVELSAEPAPGVE